MDKVIIAVDLGHFKAYRVTRKEHESPRIQLIESYDSIEAHGKLSDLLSDSAGRFGVGGGKNGAAKGYGEPHHIETEMEKTASKLISFSPMNNYILSDSSRAILSSTGGCVLNSFIIAPPLKGLTIIICDVAGVACIGIICAPLCSLRSAFAKACGFP